MRPILRFALSCLLVGLAPGGAGVAHSAQAAPNPAPLIGALTMGPHAVGYKTLDGISPTASAWYPATAASDGPVGSSRMTFRTYLGSGTDAFVGFLASATLSRASIDAFVNAPMQARVGAEPEPGTFPIVAMGQGNAERAADQAVFCEWLASHGFIIVTTDSPMVATPMTKEDEVGPFAERQAGNLTRAMNEVAAWPSADANARWAMGHSFGGRAALLVAMRDARVKGVVSLDGGIGTATAIAAFKTAKSFNATKATAPILHFYERLDEFMTPDFAFLESLPATRTLVDLPGMHHSHFTTLGFASAVLPELASLTKAGPELPASLETMTQQTLAFLRR